MPAELPNIRDGGSLALPAHHGSAKLVEALVTPGKAVSAPFMVVIVAHPDDEVIGAGSRLPRMRYCQFLHVTDGAPRDGRDAQTHGFASIAEYAAARRVELESALALCGIPSDHARRLNCADQEASLHVSELTQQLRGLLLQYRPKAVMTHPYEGGHPDHDATAFAVHAAVALMSRDGPDSPDIIEMTSYHFGPSGIVPCHFLPFRGVDEVSVALNEQERAFKRRLFDCFPTQRDTLANFPITVERFRLAPRYDFLNPPHEGKLYYECFDWHMTGRRFCELAAEAMNELGLEGRL